VFTNEKILWEFPEPNYPEWAVKTVKFQKEIEQQDLQAKISFPDGQYDVKVIGLQPHSLLTDLNYTKLEVKNGWIHPDPNADILSLSVIERYGINGNISNAFIQGFGIKAKRFAMATTVAHDSHNLIVAGTDHDTMVKAVNLVHNIQGGYVVIIDDIAKTLALPFGGLMSTRSYRELHRDFLEINKVFEEGVTDFDEPLMALSFMALPVIPHLKITDKGLVDVDKFVFTDLIENPS